MTGYYLQDHPNPTTPQYGWERAKLGQPETHLSGVVGVHTSEAITDFEGVDNNAENNAAFLARRPEHGSYHTSADADSIVPLVHPRYAAWADTTNNAHAMSVSGCLQAARWLEMTPARRRAVVVNMAVAAARMVLTAVADGYLARPTPAVRISAAEAISGSRPGFYGHGETNPGTRYDPGQHFDWDLFLSTYAAAIGGTITTHSATSEEDELNKDQDAALGIVFHKVNQAPAAGQLASQGDINIVLARVSALEATVLEALGKPRPEPSAVLVKGDEQATVYAWDGGTGYRALDYNEFAALMASGAELRTVDQSMIVSAEQ